MTNFDASLRSEEVQNIGGTSANKVDDAVVGSTSADQDQAQGA